MIAKKSLGGGDHSDGENGSGDSKKENNRNDTNNGTHSEGSGDVHQATRKSSS